MILTLSPERITDPSTTASTRNSLAISGRDLPAPLYLITDVREMTRNSLILEMARQLAHRSCRPKNIPVTDHRKGCRAAAPRGNRCEEHVTVASGHSLPLRWRRLALPL